VHGARAARARRALTSSASSPNIIRACQMRIERVEYRVNLLSAGLAARSHCVFIFLQNLTDESRSIARSGTLKPYLGFV
jgi:hypothetical protein